MNDRDSTRIRIHPDVHDTYVADNRAKSNTRELGHALSILQSQKEGKKKLKEKNQPARRKQISFFLSS